MRTKVFLLMALLGPGLLSCTEEGRFDGSDKGDVYLNVSVSVPSTIGTKSSTTDDGESSDGIENGTESESSVSSITVIAVDNLGNIVSTTGLATVPTLKKPGGGSPYDGSTVRYETNTFPVTGLEVSKTYKFYVFANATAAQVNTDYPAGSFDETKAFSITSVDDITNGIAKDNSFLMTNAETVTEGTILESAKNKNTPFQLEVKVERSAARFDYAVNQGNRFQVYENEREKIFVTLEDYAFMNIHKSFYYFKRVSDDGSDANWVLGGKETPVNYVVDTDHAKKTGKPSGTPDYFLNPLKGTTGANYSKLPTSDERLGYLTENTIPADPENQKYGYTTAVVFKARLSFDGFSDPTGNIYTYSSVFYKDWASLYKVVDKYDDLDANEASAGNTKEKLEGYGIKRISPDAGEYYVYYIYWNRHNDNGKEGEMGPMEFAVVRNNLYRLKVESISELGHPNDPLNPDPEDPDPEDPDPEDPDEKANLYMNVKVEVLPWVLRLNNIHF